jgi:hypothetical protein
MSKLALNIGDELFRYQPGISSSTTLGDLVNNLVPTLYIVASVILFLLLLFFGLRFIMGAGAQSPEDIAKAKSALVWTLVGFLVIFGSYWIIQILKTITGINLLAPGGI